MEGDAADTGDERRDGRSCNGVSEHPNQCRARDEDALHFANQFVLWFGKIVSYTVWSLRNIVSQSHNRLSHLETLIRCIA